MPADMAAPSTGGVFPPKSRVRYAPSNGPARPATVLHKVNDVDAYSIRLSGGQKLTIPATQLQPKVKGQSA